MNTGAIKLVLTAVVVFVGFIFLFNSMVTIDEQEIGVVTHFGKIDGTLDAGFHLVNPFTTDVTKMSLEVEALQLDELVYSKDAQIVGTQAVINYRLVRSEAVQVFTDVRRDYEGRYVLPEARDALKAVMSKYTAQELIENRSTIPLEIRTRLQEELADKGVEVVNIAVENFDFDDSYEQAIQNKQVQEQQALAQVNITKQEEEKKKQEILKAEALAEKTRLEVQALSTGGSEIIAKIYAEAQLEMAKRWTGVMPTHMYAGSPFPLVDVSNSQ